MRVSILADVEGVAGISKWAQTTRGDSRAYQECRILCTEDAAVRGARAGRANEGLVPDCHGAGDDWPFNSLIPERLEPSCEFAVQSSWTEYVQPLEQGCDAALLIGMHARAGTAAGIHSHSSGLAVAQPEVQWPPGR